MTAGAARVPDRPPGAGREWTSRGLAFVLAVPLGLILAYGLYRFPPPAGLAVAGGAGVLMLLALAVANLHAAVALGIGLLGVVLIEPAPADGALCVVMAVALVTGRFRLAAAPRAAVAIVAMLAALNVMSSIQVADAGRAAGFFAITLYLAAFGLWLPGYVTSEGRARLIVEAYLFAAVSSALLGMLALAGVIPGAAVLTEDGRARALFQDPNVFGPFLVPAALIVAEELVRPRLLRLSSVTKALLLAVLVLGVVFSYSRGAWLNLVLALAVMGVVFAVRGGVRQALALVAVGLVGAAVVAGAVVATGSADFLAERARPQTYDTTRFAGQRAGLQPAWEYPFGAGPGQFEAIAGISAHSTYARAIGEQGFLGVLVLAALLGFTLGAAVRNAARGSDTYGIGSAALVAAWLGLLANSAFIDTLHWRHLWLVAGLIWAGTMLGARARPR
ncbi:MAG TPA: O-antigen ligase family protein [Solirubrobacteraceae bacterium]|nr:O-antigen ligase family protein [Solirubrobacteraceae bacterium]